MKYLAILVLPLAALAAENPLDCVSNAPASAHYCKPGEVPRASIEIEVKNSYGTMEGPFETCEVQRIWTDGGVCNYCRTEQDCGET